MDSEDLAYTINEACKKSRSSRAYMYQQIAEGKLRARKRGRRTVILPADLRAWVESLPEFKPSRRSSGTVA